MRDWLFLSEASISLGLSREHTKRLLRASNAREERSPAGDLLYVREDVMQLRAERRAEYERKALALA